MPSMSYCKFENTVTNLRACRDSIIENEELTSEYEIRAKKRLIELCKEIAEYCD
jgi:hypothetical protein